MHHALLGLQLNERAALKFLLLVISLIVDDLITLWLYLAQFSGYKESDDSEKVILEPKLIAIQGGIRELTWHMYRDWLSTKISFKTFYPRFPHVSMSWLPLASAVCQVLVLAGHSKLHPCGLHLPDPRLRNPGHWRGRYKSDENIFIFWIKPKFPVESDFLLWFQIPDPVRKEIF